MNGEITNYKMELQFQDKQGAMLYWDLNYDVWKLNGSILEYAERSGKCVSLQNGNMFVKLNNILGNTELKFNNLLPLNLIKSLKDSDVLHHVSKSNDSKKLTTYINTNEINNEYFYNVDNADLISAGVSHKNRKILLLVINTIKTKLGIIQ